MIVHKYFEWHEPEKPPFTVDDVVKAITEIMMRYHISFDEALRYLQMSGLNYNSFLNINGLDILLDALIEDLKKQKKQLQEKYDLNNLIEKENKLLQQSEDKLQKKLSKVKNKKFSTLFKELTNSKNLDALYHLKWLINRSEPGPIATDISNNLDQIIFQMETLFPVIEFNESYPFSGKEPITKQQALKLIEKFQAIDKLIAELENARKYGDLLNVSEKKLKEILGEKAYKGFKKKRDELLNQFNQAMEESGLVERDDDNGIYKLTPAAARKIGEESLSQVYSMLKTDGMGKHTAIYKGEGCIEQVPTKHFEYGDSFSNIDITSSLMNTLVRTGSELPIKMKMQDIVVHETKGMAKTALVIMIDMSGSMSRFGRFYNTKKVSLALDSLVRTQFPEDKIYFVGFYTYAKQFKVGDIIHLSPKPVTRMGESLNLRIDFSKYKSRKDRAFIPEHFTNLQKGMELSRMLLQSEDTNNKNIIIITDGAPTAFYDGPFLHLTYPPTEKTYNMTLKEVKACTEENIKINIFMLANDFDFDYYGERNFINKVLKINKGSIFYPKPDKLTQYILIDYFNHKRKIVEI